MKEENIKPLLKTGILRKRQRDDQKIKSMLESSETNAKVTKTIPLN